jgi:hypothetical protein
MHKKRKYKIKLNSPLYPKSSLLKNLNSNKLQLFYSFANLKHQVKEEEYSFSGGLRT